jgi:hypothetical protein
MVSILCAIDSMCYYDEPQIHGISIKKKKKKKNKEKEQQSCSHPFSPTHLVHLVHL